MTERTHIQLREAYQLARRGDLRKSARFLAVPGTDAPEEHAWRQLLSVSHWLFDPAAGRFPPWSELETSLQSESATPEVKAFLAGSVATAATVCFDGELLQRVAPHASALMAQTRDLEARLTCCLVNAWGQFASGTVDLDEALDEWGKQASRAQIAPLVVELHALRAAVALQRGDLHHGTQLARRTSRMARTEGLPQQEYLAHTVLARLRRLAGRPYLAARILTALTRVCPTPWRGWLAWESALAGMFDRAHELAATATSPHAENAAARSAMQLRALVQAAQSGEEVGFHARREELIRTTSGWALAADEARALTWLLDPATPLENMGEQARSWCTGRSHTAPYGLEGVSYDPKERQTAVAYVCAGPTIRPRRVLSVGVPLAVRAHAAERLPQSQRRRGRADVAVAVLLLSPDGLSDEDFFRSAYGFDYRPRVHRGVFDVLKHRMREHLGPRAHFAREGDGNRILLRRSVVAPDPRCQRSVTDQVLWILAAGNANAKEVAERIGISLRATQEALKELVEDGACVMTRDGRRHIYAVEDTTFSEPTLA